MTFAPVIPRYNEADDPYLKASAKHFLATSDRLQNLSTSSISVQKNGLVTLVKSFQELGENWDGFNANAISDACVNNAISYIEFLPSSFPLQAVYPNPNGTISFDFESADNFMTLEIGDSKVAGYTKCLRKVDPIDGNASASTLRALARIVSYLDIEANRGASSTSVTR